MRLVSTLVWLAVLLAICVPFFQGIEDWLGITGFSAIIIFIVLMYMGRPGALVLAAIGFHGATARWGLGWAWPEALLLVLPYPVLLFTAFALRKRGIDPRSLLSSRTTQPAE